MSEQLSSFVIQAIQNTTVLYDKKPIAVSQFHSWLENKHPGKDLNYWVKTKNDFFSSLRSSGVSYNDLPEPDRTNFFESIKVTSCMEQMVEVISFLTEKPFFKYYYECQKPDFIAAKQALVDNLPMLIKQNKKQFHLDFKKTFFGIPQLKSYFGAFIFNMKNKHSGKYELVIGKKIHFPTSVDDLEHGAIFRFMDCVDTAFKKAIYDEDKKIVNTEEIVRSIFLPQIWNGCGYCDDTNFMTFNHKDGTVDEIYEAQCPLAKKDTSKQISEITTNGKLIFCNDVRLISNVDKMDDKLSQWGRDNKISTYLNTWDGQQGFMTAYAQLFNVGYIQAGNHGACLKKTKNGLKVTYGKGNTKALGDISLSLWGVCFIDYDKAVELAGSEKELLEKLQGIEHYVADVKPGTYQVVADCTVNEEKSYNSKKDLAFGLIQWLHE